MNVDEILRDRNATHGNYAEQARCAQRLKILIHDSPRWADLSMIQRDAIEMILTKISRLVHGDPNHGDHFSDIAGYATLAGGWTAKPASTEPAGGDSPIVPYETRDEFIARVRRS